MGRNRLCRPFKKNSPYSVIYWGSIVYINVLKRQFTSPIAKGEENEENLWYLPMQARLLFPVILNPLLQTQAKEPFSFFLHSERRGQKSPCLTHSFRAEIKFSCNYFVSHIKNMTLPGSCSYWSDLLPLFLPDCFIYLFAGWADWFRFGLTLKVSTHHFLPCS